MKTRTVVFAAVALSIFGAFAGTLRIMPLGDSITYGQGWDPHGGYRAVLREKLVAAGYDVDYVGNETRNQGTLKESGDIEHEGHPGWRVDQVTKMFPTWSSQIDGPNIILLKIGTNNCNSDHATVIGQIGELLDTIKRVQPSAHVIVSTLVPFLNGSEVGSNNVWVEEHNALLKMAIAQRVAAGDLVSLVDIYPVVSPTTGMNDDRHPNEEGYRAMAQAWFDAIAAVCPDPATAGGNVVLTATKAELDSASGNVTVWFNQAIDAASATAACFQCGTLEWASVDVAGDARSATLTPAVAPKAGTTHEVSVSGVTAGSKTVVAHTFSLSCLPPGARNYVPEAGQYRKVYEYAIPTVGGALNTNGATYNLDEHGLVGKFTRIAYYVELVDANGILQYLWVSMDAFTNDVSKIGVPTLPSGAFFQQYVYNMHVYSNVSTITPGEKEVGNIEFWPYNYFGTAKLGIPGATGGYDVDDSCNMNGNFACMQIHDTAALVPLFCYNNWGGNANGTCDLGLGPNTSGNLDWTQNGGGNSWPGGRKLEVYVLEDVDDETVPALLSATLSESRRAIDVVFDYPIAEEPDFSALVSLSGGVEVKSARRDPSDARILHVSCSFVAKPSATTLSVAGLHAGSPRHTPVPAFALQLDGTDYESGFPSAPQGVVDKVPAAADFAHLFTIDIQPSLNLNIKDGTTYVNKVDPDAYDACHVVNNTNSAPEFYSRVGYLLELVDKSDHTNWVWTAFDAFSSDYGDIDVPTANPDHPKGGYVNGRFVSNLDIASNVDGITTGTGLTTGVIEFSPWDYGGTNKRNVPNATGDYDFGDDLYERVGNYACMQVANYDARQIVWAFGRFNGRGVCVGIGNSTNGNNIDYTFDNNAGNYKSRTLYVLVKPDYDADTSTDYEPIRAVASSDLRRVAVSFRSSVGELAAQPRYYTVAGATIAKAEVSSIDSRDVILTLASPLVSNSTCTVETQFPKSTNKSMSFNTVRGLPSALVEGVEEIGDYTLLNDLTIPYNCTIARDGADYRTDESRFGLGRKVERIAYALELQYNAANGGEYRWAWVSMDPFTEDPAMMGVPSVTRGNHFQCYVDNISVRAGSSSGASPIATGEWSQGNIEFTPSNYASENEKNIPNALGNKFDFGDRLYGSGSQYGHGCMQIHNYLEQDMILGFTRLGNSMVPGLYIGLIRDGEGNVTGDGTNEANRHNMTAHELRVFVKLAAEEPVVGDKGVGPEFLVQPSSVVVKTGAGLPPQTVTLNAYAPGAVRYQWRKNGADIPGATGPVLDVVVSRVGSDEYTVIAFADDENYTFSRPATVSGIPIAFVITIR